VHFGTQKENSVTFVAPLFNTKSECIYKNEHFPRQARDKHGKTALKKGHYRFEMMQAAWSGRRSVRTTWT
jgi:hypothetical protein